MIPIEVLEYALQQKLITKQTYSQIASSLRVELNGMSGEQLRTALRRYKNSIPDPNPKLFQDVLQLPIQNTLIIADLHTPYQNTKVLNLAIQIARGYNVTDVDIAGDLHDFNSLSSQNKGEPTTSYDTDIIHSRRILEYLATYFDRITVMNGNHDEYYPKKKGGTFQDLIYNDVLLGRLQDQITVTNYDYILRGNEYLIGHLSQYTENPGELAAQLADKHNRHILVGHDHIRGYKRSNKGYIGASIGCMLEPDRFYYKVRRINTFPDFQIGFAMILDEDIYLYDETGREYFSQ